ncbi:MAG: 1,4-alpha-glucan branching protein domain-containing protein [Thermoleophilaceae bacterium]
MTPRGGLALVLHTHMPYVEGFGTWPFGEEWLFEAAATVYLPILEVLDGAPVTVGLTPVLCDQLEALRGDAGDRFLAFLREVRAPIHEEDARGLERGGELELAAELRRAAGDYERAERTFEALGRDVVDAFASLGGPQLWTSSATHAVLPLLATDPGLRLQVAAGVASHERRFGAFGGGFWLPECAYAPGLERDLSEHRVAAFCVDQTDALGLGAPEQLEPVATGAGPVAVPIDWATVSLVWDERTGYPTHAAYRDYHGRTVHDLRPWNNAGGPYRHDHAVGLAREHARDFVARVAQRLEARPGGLVTCALDTELLGHWWYEGIEWLRAVLEEAPAQGVELVTLPDALDGIAAVERPLAESSWGTPKDLSTWDSPRVAELCVAARRAELRTVAAAAGTHADDPSLARAARELMALQASDWSFQVTRELAADYPLERVRAHAAANDAALAALADSALVPEPSLRSLAPALDLAPLVAP